MTDHRRLTTEELAEIMPRRTKNHEPLLAAISIATVVLVFVAGWVVGLLTVLFTL